MKKFLLKKLDVLYRRLSLRGIDKVDYSGLHTSPNSVASHELLLVIPQSALCMVLWDVKPSYTIFTYSHTGEEMQPGFLSSTESILACPAKHLVFKSEGWGESLDYILEFCDGYKLILIASDDTFIRSSDIQYLFALAACHGLDFFHPSLSACSYYTHSHLVNKPGSIVRCVPHIEGIFPGFSSKAVDCLKSHTGISTSGYGLDVYLWPEVAKRNGLRTAVIDAVMTRHCRPVRTGTIQYSNGFTSRDETEYVRQYVLHHVC